MKITKAKFIKCIGVLIVIALISAIVAVKVNSKEEKDSGNSVGITEMQNAETSIISESTEASESNVYSTEKIEDYTEESEEVTPVFLHIYDSKNKIRISESSIEEFKGVTNTIWVDDVIGINDENTIISEVVASSEGENTFEGSYAIYKDEEFKGVYEIEIDGEQKESPVTIRMSFGDKTRSVALNKCDKIVISQDRVEVKGCKGDIELMGTINGDDVNNDTEMIGELNKDTDISIGFEDDIVEIKASNKIKNAIVTYSVGDKYETYIADKEIKEVKIKDNKVEVK